MKKVLLVILLTSLLFTTCKKSTNEEPADKDSIEYFNYNLRADMKYDDIVNQFGAPDGDIGSGIHIYVYDLNDGSKVYIGYTDKIMYARHVNSNGQTIHTII